MPVVAVTIWPRVSGIFPVPAIMYMSKTEYVNFEFA